MSFETRFDSKQPKLEPKLVSALSERKRLFRLIRFYIETASFGVSIKPKLTETNRNKPKQTETSPCPVPGHDNSKAARYCLVCYLWTCLSYSNLCCLWSCITASYATTGHICSKAASEPVLPGRVFSIESMLPLDVPVLKQTVLPLNGSVLQHPELPLHLSVLLFYSILCCL